MQNPWLNVPLADYEGHMDSAGVEQLGALAELFAEVLALRRPASVAVIGIAGGNGLDRIDSTVTRRVIGLDFNPSYLERTASRYANLDGLELHCVDLARDKVVLAPVELVHAALVFEHAGTERCLNNTVSLVGKDGGLSVVLQLPSQSEAAVGASAFPAMSQLKELFSFVDPVWLEAELVRRGFRKVHEVLQPVPAGKRFWMAVFEREA